MRYVFFLIEFVTECRTAGHGCYAWNLRAGKCHTHWSYW